MPPENAPPPVAPPAPPPVSPPASPPVSPPASPPAAPAAKFYGEVGGDGGITLEDATWIEQGGYKSLPDLVKASRNAEKLLGGDRKSLLQLPADMTDEGAMRGVYSRIGLPENAAGYELKPAPELGLDEKTTGSFAEAMHKAGVPRQFVGAVMNWYSENVKGIQAADAEYAATRGKNFQTWADKEWGAAKDQRLAAANALIREYQAFADGKAGEGKAAGEGERLGDFLKDSGLAEDPRFAGFIDWIQQKVADPTKLPGADGRETGGALAPAQALAQLEEFDKANAAALNDPNFPDRAAVIAKRRELLQAAYPPAPASQQ